MPGAPLIQLDPDACRWPVTITASKHLFAARLAAAHLPTAAEHHALARWRQLDGQLVHNAKLK